MLARSPEAEIKKKILKEKNRLKALESQMQFQELLDQKDFNIAGIASTSQIQDGAYDIEGMAIEQPFAQSEDELELLKQIDSLKQKQQQLISERIKILEMRMKLEGYDPESYISPDPQTGGDIPQPAKRAAPQRKNMTTFSSPKPSSVDSQKSSFTNIFSNARNYLLDGKASQALALLRPSASTENNNPEYHFLVGRAYQELKLNTESLESYSLAIHLNPQNHKYWINRGLIKGALKDPQGSLKDLSKSLSIKKTAMGYLNRGVTLAALNKPQEAIQDLTNAIEIDPSYSQAYRNRGIILKHRGDTFSACKDWKKANDLGDIDMKYWLSSYCSEVSFKF